MANQMVLPVRTGYEAVIGSRLPDKYVATAKKNGVVKSISKNTMIVTYEELGDKKISLKSWTTKEENGTTYKHDKKTDLKKGDKFKSGDTLSYDTAFFEQDIFDKTMVVMKMGMVLRTLIVEEQETYEDSFSISEKISKTMKSTITKVKSIIITSDQTVTSVINIDDKVDYNTGLLTLIPRVNEDFDAGVDLSKNVKSILSEIKNKTPLAKVNGVLDKIVIYYNSELTDLPKEVRDLCIISDKNLQETTGDNKITGQVNSSYSIKGKPLLMGDVEIKFYINTSNGMTIGDKAVLANQLKCTVGNVFSNDTRTKDGNIIEAKFSSRSIAARIVNSPSIIGTTTTLLKKLTDDCVNMYFDE